MGNNASACHIFLSVQNKNDTSKKAQILNPVTVSVALHRGNLL